jgi:hypothetical protein
MNLYTLCSILDVGFDVPHLVCNLDWITFSENADQRIFHNIVIRNQHTKDKEC